MTNKDKFIEVFGFEPDTETMIPVCPPRGVECPFMDDGIYSECHCELWWGREYKAPYGKDAYNKGYADGMKAQEPRKGHWLHRPHVYGVTYCSVCDFELKIDNTNYCPNCGADMREVEE